VSEDVQRVIDRLLADTPSFHRVGNRDVSSIATRGMLVQLAQELHAGQRTIETGCGASTVVFAASGASHTAVSPTPLEHERIVQYFESIGVDLQRVRFVAGGSDAVLPSLEDEDEFDVVMIDGAHSFPYAILDWHYLRSHLRPGGVVLLDDLPIPAIGVLFRYLAESPSWRVEGIVDRRAAVCRKLSNEPEGDDWVAQAFNRRYPDYSFLPRGEQVVTRVDAAQHRARHHLAERFPALRRLTRRR
jgi:precorrin-6B methylase 2